MAISCVGGANASNNDGANCTIDLTTISGLAEDDIVIVAYAAGEVSASDETMSMVTSGYTKVADLFSNDGRDTNFGVFWKVMGASVDTTAVTTGLGGPGAAQVAAVAIAVVFSSSRRFLTFMFIL